MIEKIVYVANDGTAFNSQDECLEYEASTEFFDLLQSITFFSDDGKVIDFENNISAFSNTLDDAAFILIPSYLKDERIKYFSDTIISDLYGKQFPTATGFYRWDYADDEWVSYKAEMQSFIKKWKSILNITIFSERC